MDRKKFLSVSIGLAVAASFLSPIFVGYKAAHGEEATDAAVQQFQGLLKGYPIASNVNVLPFPSGDPMGIAICTSSNKKVEAYSSTTYMCQCVAFAGWCIPQTPQSITVNFTEGGTKSDKISFQTMRIDPYGGVHMGSVTALITAAVYDGNAELDAANLYGDFSIDNGGGQFNTTGGGGFPVGIGDSPGIGEGDTFPTGTNVQPPTNNGGAYPNGGGEFPTGGGNNGGDSPDNDDYLKEGENLVDKNGGDDWGNTVNDLLNDNGGFNASDDDWTSAGGGKDGASNLDDYLNGAWDGADGMDGATTDDLLGLNDSSANGSDSMFNNADTAKLLDTNGDAIADAIDLDGDGKPDGVLLDTNGDGKMDAVDFNNDGKPDAWLIDEDGDGVMDGIDFNGDGKIDQYFDGHKPVENSDSENAEQSLNGADGFSEDFDATDEQLLDVLRQQLATNSARRMGMDAGGASSALGTNAFSNGLFGNDEQNVKNNTVSNQELFELGRTLLAKMGINEQDILKGKQYAKDSAWTEPDKAWDFNRITTLLKKKKVKTPVIDAKRSTTPT